MSLIQLTATGGDPMSAVIASGPTPDGELQLGDTVSYNVTLSNSGGTSTVQLAATVGGVDPALVSVSLPAPFSILGGGNSTVPIVITALAAIPVGAAITVDLDYTIL